MPDEIPLQQSRLLLAAIVDSSDDAIIAKDLNSIITSWNAGAQRIFGYTAEEIVGRSVLTLMPPELQGEEADIIGRIRRGERLDHFETQRVTKDGRIVEISLTVSPVRNEAGEIIGASKIARDITERKRVERQLDEAQHQLRSYATELERRVEERTCDLQKTVGELEAFSYSLTHDLRAPLRAIQSFLQIFMEDHCAGLDAGAARTMQKAIDAAQRMDGMILDLLAFTRLGHEVLALEPVDVEKLLEILRQDRPEFGPPGAEVTVQSPMPRVMGNRASLVQCLSNLLDNAVKFVAPGVKPKVRVYAQDEGATVRLVVEDNGVGVDTEDQDEVFRIFHRLHGSEYPGTGIGLAIVRKAAERMGGGAGFESEPGQGSRFWLQLRKAA
jgi:PAS domain S-box-containing protein